MSTKPERRLFLTCAQIDGRLIVRLRRDTPRKQLQLLRDSLNQMLSLQRVMH